MNRRRGGQDIGLLAGWLFADLLLGFGMIVFASSGGSLPSADAASAATTSSTSTTTSTTTSTSTTTTVPPGIEQVPHIVEIQGNYALMTGAPSAERDAEINRLRGELLSVLDREGFGGRRAALVLTFGFHPQVGQGQRLATSFNDGVLATVPDVFSGAALRFFDYRSSPTGRIRAEIYFFTAG